MCGKCSAHHAVIEKFAVDKPVRCCDICYPIVAEVPAAADPVGADAVFLPSSGQTVKLVNTLGGTAGALGAAAATQPAFTASPLDHPVPLLSAAELLGEITRTALTRHPPLSTPHAPLQPTA